MSTESNDRKPLWEPNPSFWEPDPKMAKLEEAIGSVRERVGNVEYFIQTGVCSRTRVPISAETYFSRTARRC